MTEPSLEKKLHQEKLVEAMRKTEKWFSEVHDGMYSDHAKAAKSGDGLFCKIFESAMGAHDRAWARWGFFLQDCGVPLDVQRGWRKETQKP